MISDGSKLQGATRLAVGLACGAFWGLGAGALFGLVLAGLFAQWAFSPGGRLLSTRGVVCDCLSAASGLPWLATQHSIAKFSSAARAPLQWWQECLA